MPVVTDPEFLSFIVSISGVGKADHVLERRERAGIRRDGLRAPL